MNTKTVKAAAFAFLGPDALRIVLANRGYRVSIYSGDPKTLMLVSDGNNVVILPNMSKKDSLYKYADKIKYLLLYVDGKASEARTLGIPILDADIVDGRLQLKDSRTPAEYIELIEKKSSDLTLVDREKTHSAVKSPNKGWPETYDAWLSLLEKLVSKDVDFQETVEIPTFMFLAALSDKESLKADIKRIINNEKTKKAATYFFKWLIGDDGKSLSKAYLSFMADTEADIYDIAEKYDVEPDDLILLYSTAKEVE